MSFEKKMKKRGNQKLDAFVKNPYHQEPEMETKPVRKEMPLWSKILIPLTSVAVAIFGTFIGIRMVFGDFTNMATNKGGYNYNDEQNAPAEATSRDEKGISDTPYSPSSPESGTCSWEELSITSQYPNVNYISQTYITYSNEKSEAIDIQYIGNLIEENVVVNGHDYALDIDYTTKVNIYNIKNISIEAGIAIKFIDSSNYYAYVCSNYLCKTYDELFDELGFINEIVLESASYRDENGHMTNRSINNQDDLKTILSSYKEKGLNNIYPNNPDVPIGENESVIISFSIPCLDIKTANIEFYNNGLLSIRLSHAFPHIFNVGVSEYNAFKDAIMLAIQ